MNDSASYSMERNEIYSFIAVDNVGNKVYNSIEINNIDKPKPTLEILKDPNTEWSNVDVNVIITG